MSVSDAVLLFVIMALLALTPSTSVVLVVTRSASAGFRNGAAAAAGIVLGDLVFVFIALLGMAALAEVMGSLFLILRYAAGAYLIWMGLSLLRSKPRPGERSGGASRSSLAASVAAGFLLTLGDVKAIFFYASLFPVFVDIGSIGPADIALIVFLTVVAVGGAKVAYAYGARGLMTLTTTVKAERGVTALGGSALVGAGAWLMAKAWSLSD